MTLLLRSILCLMVISYVNFYTINIDYAVAAEINQESQVTEHEPKVRISNLKDLPKGKGGNWLWAILGVVAIAGGVAAMVSVAVAVVVQMMITPGALVEVGRFIDIFTDIQLINIGD